MPPLGVAGAEKSPDPESNIVNDQADNGNDRHESEGNLAQPSEATQPLSHDHACGLQKTMILCEGYSDTPAGRCSVQ